MATAAQAAPEREIGFREAAKYMGLADPSVVWRRANEGAYGIKLEARQVSGSRRWVTTREACDRFTARVDARLAAERAKRADKPKRRAARMPGASEWPAVSIPPARRGARSTPKTTRRRSAS